MTDLPRVVAESDIGSIANVQLWRKNKIINIEVQLGELPEEAFVDRELDTEKSLDEFFIENLNLLIGKNKDKKIIVLKIDSLSNLKIGDIIIEVNRELVTDPQSFLDLVSSIKKTGRNSLLLKILRKEESMWITIQFIK